MSRLAISLLGTFQVSLDGVSLTTFETDKARALLAYLAVEAGHPHRRESLAALFWPDRPEQAARNNLRQALYRLLNAIREQESSNPYLLLTSHQIQFNLASEHWLDTAEFENLISHVHAHHPQGLSLCTGCKDKLEAAIERYQGEFMSGFSLPDCPQFAWWQLSRQEAYHHRALDALARLERHYDTLQDYDRVSDHAQREIKLEPWRESAHRRRMRALALAGERGEALRQYEICRSILSRELGVEPATETTRLYQQIRDMELDALRALLAGGETQGVAESFSVIPPGTDSKTPFVGFEPELAQLERHLQAALAGKGGVVFITGGAGRGKTTLSGEFARRAMAAHGDLQVAWGGCRAQAGLGDPYLPFREILDALCGKTANAITCLILNEEHARRLAAAGAEVRQALRAASPDVADSLLPSEALSGQAQGSTPRITSAQHVMGQAALFEQVSQVMLTLARRYPLVLVLDDLQWTDRGSISLLFHLGRRLSGNRILVIGAYRPEEVALGRAGKRHPLQPVVHEFITLFGDIQIDLSCSDGRSFVNAYLDSEANRLDQNFREKLYQLTGGHPLFTVELLRGLQERGELVKDVRGRWVSSPDLDWERLPVRVEAVIAERLARLCPEYRSLLEAASVQGETFSVELLARVLGISKSRAIKRLSGELCKQHRLVQAGGIRQLGDQARYHFRHALYQKYIYQNLDAVERAHLHQSCGEALEELYGPQIGEITSVECSPARLAWHFEMAGLTDKAIAYLLQAGQQAYRLSANKVAIELYERGLELLALSSKSPQRSQQELSLLVNLCAPLVATRSYADPGLSHIYSRAYELAQECGQVEVISPVLFSLGSYHLTRADYPKTEVVGRQLLRLSQDEGISWGSYMANFLIGLVKLYLGQFDQARQHLAILPDDCMIDQSKKRTGVPDRNVQAFSLAFLSWALWFLGYPDQALQCSQKLLAWARAQDHPYSLAFSVGMAPCMVYTLRREYHLVEEHANTLLQLSGEKGFSMLQAWGKIFIGRAQAELGQLAQGLENLRQGLEGYQATGQLNTYTFLLALLAETYGLAGQIEAGHSTLSEALNLSQKTSERFYEAELYRLRGELLLRQVETQSGTDTETTTQRAEKHFQRALQIARQQGAKILELRATTSLCRLWGQQGKEAEACHMLGKIYNWFTEGLDTPDLLEAQALLDELMLATPV